MDDKVFVLTSKKELPETIATEGEDQNDLEHSKALLNSAQNEVNQILMEADLEADKILKNAQNSSDAIISDAYDKAKEIMASAQEKGYQDGYDLGLKEGQTAAEVVLEQAQNIKNEWLNVRKGLLEDAEREMVEILVETLEKMLNHHLENDEHLIESLIRLSVERVTKTERLTIRVSNEDYNQAVGVKPLIETMSDKIEAIEIKRDSTLTAGSCIIDGDSGSIDSSVWTQFEQVKKIFEDMLKGE